MPHVYINEKDNTVAGSIDENTNVVYVPGLKASDGTLKDNEPTLFRTTKALKAALGSYSTKNWNARMAEMYISLGLPVLFESFGKEDDFIKDDEELESGELPELNFDAVAALVDWDKLSDRGLYRI